MKPIHYPVTKGQADCLVQSGRIDEARSVLRRYLDHPHLGDYGRSMAVAQLQELEPQYP